MSKQVIVLQGLPGSGKSTYARELIDNNPGKYKRVNKDELRMMVDNGKFSKANEELILELRDSIIDISLLNGYDVIVDDTNFEKKHIEQIAKVSALNNATVILKKIETDLDTCIERDLKRQNSVGEKVIRSMYNKYIKKIETVEYDPKLKDAIIVDIDGTLAHSTHRSMYEWDKVGEDRKDLVISEIVDKYLQDYFILIVSGRDGACKDITEKWLRNNKIFYNELYMRPIGDNRKDTIVKEEIYNNYIKGKYNIKFVLDDRNCVVEKWRDLGLRCLQVADGDF